jgi:hypothetical protein
MSFASAESAWLEPDDPPELPDGWWDEDQVKDVVESVKNLLDEQVYEDRNVLKGISVKMIARINVLAYHVGIMNADDPIVIEAMKLLGLES